MRITLKERSLAFGIGVLKLVHHCTADLTRRSREQLASSATSIGANISEARPAQSRADFISKMEIALKEARETDYWLRILDGIQQPPLPEMAGLMNECWEITAILVTSIKTAKRNGGINEIRLQKGKAESRVQK